MKRIAGGWLLLVLLVSHASGQLADFDARRAAARATLLTDLESYVAWCQTKELFQERSKAYQLVLELAPEHAEALKVLGYVRDKDGHWKAPEKPKAYRDFDRKALEEAPARFRAVSAGFVTQLVALLDSGKLSSAQRALAAADVLRFDAENEHVHTLLGEVHSEKGWVIPETLRAREHREELRTWVRQALENAPAAAPAPLTEREQKIPLKMKAVAVPGLRIVGTVDAEELALTAQALQALESLLQTVFQSKYALPDDVVVFLLADPKEGPVLVEHHPSLGGEQRAAYGKLEGAGFQGTNDFAFWTGDSQRRIDGVVRLVLGFWLSGAFQISVEQGWIYEGFGLFLTRSLVRTRMTWLAQPSAVLDAKQDLALRQRLMDPATNWMDEAHQMLLKKTQPPLAELFKKNASQLTTEDVIYAYALATYLLEARPDIVPKLFSRVGAGYSRVAAFQEALGLDLESFEAHLCRWLGERS